MDLKLFFVGLSALIVFGWLKHKAQSPCKKCGEWYGAHKQSCGRHIEDQEPDLDPIEFDTFHNDRGDID